MRARQSFVNSSEEMVRVASASAAWLSVHSSGSLAAVFMGGTVLPCTAAMVAPASKVRLLKRSEFTLDFIVARAIASLYAVGMTPMEQS